MSMSDANPYSNPSQQPAGSSMVRPSQTMTLRRLDVFSVGKMLGVLYTIVGLFFGAIFAIVGLISAAAGGGAGAGDVVVSGVVGALFMVIMVPILYGIGGFIGGVIMAALYNLCANFVGGVRFDLE